MTHRMLLSSYFFHLLNPTTKTAPKVAPPTGGSGGVNADGVLIALGGLGVLVVLGLVAFAVLRMVQKKGDSDYEKNKFIPLRKWGWELALGEAEEAALLRGLQAWEGENKSLYLGHDEGTMTLYLPGRQVLVSLFLLADRFRALGAGADPAAVGRLVDELSAQEQPGVIAFSGSWFAVGTLDGMDHDAFLSKVRGVLTAGFDQGLPGSNGWYSDENYGRIDLRLVVEPSAEMQQLQAAGRYEEMSAAESKVKNVFLLNVGPLVGRYQRLRSEQPSLGPEDAIRTLLVDLLASPSPEHTWSRGQPPPTEAALLQASAAGRATLLPDSRPLKRSRAGTLPRARGGPAGSPDLPSEATRTGRNTWSAPRQRGSGHPARR
jgi:hypothetical protein